MNLLKKGAVGMSNACAPPRQPPATHPLTHGKTASARTAGPDLPLQTPTADPHRTRDTMPENDVYKQNSPHFL